MIDRPDQPSLGAGEGSQAPTGAAIANADLCSNRPAHCGDPFTPERVLAALRT